MRKLAILVVHPKMLQETLQLLGHTPAMPPKPAAAKKKNKSPRYSQAKYQSWGL